MLRYEYEKAFGIVGKLVLGPLGFCSAKLVIRDQPSAFQCFVRFFVVFLRLWMQNNCYYIIWNVNKIYYLIQVNL